jgi:hypothetical protein
MLALPGGRPVPLQEEDAGTRLTVPRIRNIPDNRPFRFST